jgi:hypothetical protein
MKKSFSLLELIFVILIVGIIASQSTIKNNLSKIKLAKSQLLLHLKYTRYIAMLDNKYNFNDDEWFKKRWTLKFLNCQKSIGGIYYVIYSDMDGNGAIKKDETLRDPLTNNYIYSFQCTKDKLNDKSNFVLLSEKYEIENISVSCNSTSTIGQISFGYDGNVYSRLGQNEENYKIDEPCSIKIYSKHNQVEEIIIHPNSGYIESV